MATRSILLTSTKGGSGKSVIAIGAFLKLKETGHKPGYFKPIGDSLSMTPKNRTDKDVSVISAVVARQFSKEQICPQFYNPEYFLDEVLPDEAPDVMDKIKDAYDTISAKTDFILIEGNHNFNQYCAVDLDDLRMAKEFNSEVIICAPIADDDDLNRVVGTYNYIKSQNIPIAGVILSGTTHNADTRIEKYHKPLLEHLQIKVIGGLKNSRQLEKPTIAEIMEAVNGNLISGEYIKIKNNFIDGFTIGAMGANAAISFMRKQKNQCIITGGDRSDVALGAIETGAGLIIFSGNIDPNQRVISAAEEKGIPLIKSPSDTYTITEQIKKIHTHIQPNEIQLCRDQVEDNVDWDKFPH